MTCFTSNGRCFKEMHKRGGTSLTCCAAVGPVRTGGLKEEVENVEWVELVHWTLN